MLELYQTSPAVGPVGAVSEIVKRPSSPVGPVGPVSPVGPVAPVAAAVPAGPVGPVGPVGPAEPVGPVASVKYGNEFQLVVPSPTFILPVSYSKPSSPASKIGLADVQFAAVSLRTWTITAI